MTEIEKGSKTSTPI